MSKKTWTILRIAFAIAIIGFLLTKISAADVINTILSAKLQFVIPAVILNLSAWYVASYRLKLFSEIQGLAISTIRAFEITLSTLFYGLFLPGGNLTTSVIKFYKLSWKDKKLSEGFIAIALDRLFATTALCLVGISFWMISIPDDSSEFVISMVLALLGLGVFFFIMFFDKEHRVINWSMRLANRVYHSTKLNNFVKGLDGLGKISLGYYLYIIFVSVVVHLINVSAFYLLLHSMDLDISFVTIGWIRSVVIMITIIPLTISGIGLREISFIYLLGAFGINNSSAFAYSILVFAVTRLVPGLLGGLIEAKTLVVKERTP